MSWVKRFGTLQTFNTTALLFPNSALVDAILDTSAPAQYTTVFHSSFHAQFASRHPKRYNSAIFHGTLTHRICIILQPLEYNFVLFHSTLAYTMHPYSPLHFYTATKYAVSALTEGVRQEIRQTNARIRVTVRSTVLFYIVCITAVSKCSRYTLTV
jgi:NAD(P)-dependent dehydrogenase (short-subunit alcohol dehydrogenase family)